MSSLTHEYFHWLDYVIFSLVLLISCGMGIYYAFKTKKRDKEEYLLGNRNMSWIPVGLSLVVSYTSGILSWENQLRFTNMEYSMYWG